MTQAQAQGTRRPPPETGGSWAATVPQIEVLRPEERWA
jgi:hypothetical protein